MMRASEEDIEKSNQMKIIEEIHDGEKWEGTFMIVKVSAVVFSLLMALMMDSKLKTFLHN